MATKTNERWVDAVGPQVVALLDERFGLNFEYHQHGPYTQGSNEIGIFFRDTEIQEAHSHPLPGEKRDKRFGFVVNSFLAEPGVNFKRSLSAGFSLWGKANARPNFLPNLFADLSGCATKLGTWLQRYSDTAWLSFDREQEERFRWEPRISLRYLQGELAKYGEMGRKSTGVTDLPSTHGGTYFNVGRDLTKFTSMTSLRLAARAPQIAAEALAVFEELTFLYDLLRPIEDVKKPPHPEGPEPPPVPIAPPIGPPPGTPTSAEDPDPPPIPGPLVDPPTNDVRTTTVVQRQGQGKFRDDLLNAYGNRCAVTGCTVVATLQAAHIKPYSGPKSSYTANGLLLRADVHNLFDLHLLAVDPVTNRIYVAPCLQGGEYGKYHNIELRLPQDHKKRPDRAFLKAHFELRKRK